MIQLKLFSDPDVNVLPGQRSASAYAGTEVMRRAAGWDDERRGVFADVSLVITAAWGDAGRAVRAVEVLDREIRRCASAAGEARTAAVLQGDVPVSTATHFLDALGHAQDPVGPPGGWLEIVAVEGPPVRYALRPRGLARTCLEQHAAATLAFSMAAYNVRFDMTLTCAGPEPESWKSLEHRGDQYRAISEPLGAQRRSARAVNVELERVHTDGRRDLLQAWCD